MNIVGWINASAKCINVDVNCIIYYYSAYKQAVTYLTKHLPCCVLLVEWFPPPPPLLH